MGIRPKTDALMKRAVFFDRDGVINELVDRGNNFSVRGKKIRYTAPFSYEEFFLKPQVKESLMTLEQLGFLRILVTNQPDLSYKLLKEDEHGRIMESVKTLAFNDIFVCPHGRDESCHCKKPNPGMLIEAIQKWDIDPSASYMIGDTQNDITAGKAAGCKTIIIDYHYNKDAEADARVANLHEAVEMIRDRIH